eukprot:1904200-Amphidinium_carterae.1
MAVLFLAWAALYRHRTPVAGGEVGVQRNSESTELSEVGVQCNSESTELSEVGVQCNLELTELPIHVYTSAHGECYHLQNGCAGLRNAVEVSGKRQC